jgi:hypothetical protein
MLLPPEYDWFEPVVFAALIVFLISWAGSTLVFSGRPLLNALASAVLFALIFGLLVYYGYGKVEITVSTTRLPPVPAAAKPEASPPASGTW